MENPRLDAEILVAHGLGMKRLQLYLSFDRPLTSAERDAVRALIRERGRHVPVAYLTGEREFWSLPFAVGPGVLVPRPETEHLVEVAGLDGVEQVPLDGTEFVVDGIFRLGAGSRDGRNGFLGRDRKERDEDGGHHKQGDGAGSGAWCGHDD